MIWVFDVEDIDFSLNAFAIVARVVWSENPSFSKVELVGERMCSI